MAKPKPSMFAALTARLQAPDMETLIPEKPSDIPVLAPEESLSEQKAQEVISRKYASDQEQPKAQTKPRSRFQGRGEPQSSSSLQTRVQTFPSATSFERRVTMAISGPTHERFSMMAKVCKVPLMALMDGALREWFEAHSAEYSEMYQAYIREHQP
jgi:hypothetical protein